MESWSSTSCTGVTPPEWQHHQLIQNKNTQNSLYFVCFHPGSIVKWESLYMWKIWKSLAGAVYGLCVPSTFRFAQLSPVVDSALNYDGMASSVVRVSIYVYCFSMGVIFNVLCVLNLWNWLHEIMRTLSFGHVFMYHICCWWNNVIITSFIL